MSLPVVSVVLPAYNAQRYLAEAMQSVLAQTFDHFELILVDDGSTDRTLAIAQDFAKRDSRVKVISRPNTGIVGALMDGLAIAQGEYIARMDSDDVCLPNRFDVQVKFLREHPNVDAVGSRVIVIDPYGMELFSSDHKLEHNEISNAIINGNGWAIVHPAVMFKKESLERIGGYRKKFNFLEDVDLFLRLSEVGTLANVPEHLLKYRQHPQSVTKTRVELQARLWELAIREAHARRGSKLPDDWSFAPKLPPKPEEQLRSWAWRALKEKKKQIARRHALAAFRIQPMNRESWRVLFCALRGH